MNFLSMKYFLTLSEERNFTRAAERLHVTQQTLSAHIAALERETGNRLFIRKVPLELTEAGRIFQRYAEMIERSGLSLRRELSDAAREESGLLRIGIAPRRGEILLPDVIGRFRDRYPRVRVRIVETTNNEAWTLLERNRIDLALARPLGKRPGIRLVPFGQEEITLLIPREWLPRWHFQSAASARRAWKEKREDFLALLGRCPLLLNSKNDIAGALARHIFQQAGMNPDIAVQSENMGTLLKLCLLGKGAYFCPKNLVEAMLTPADRKKLLFLPLSEGRYTICFGYTETRHPWRVIVEFIRFAKGEEKEGIH